METVEANGRITSDNGDLALEVNLEEIVVTAYRWSLYDQLFKKWQEWLNNFHLPQSSIMSILKTALTPNPLFVNPRINDPNALEGGYSWTYDEHNVPIRVRNKSEIHPEDLEAYLERQKYYEDSAQQALAKGQPFMIGAMGRIPSRRRLVQGSSKAEGVLQNINTRNVVTKTAEETNQWWKAKGLDKPPVREGTKVMEAELREETSGFVRVYDDVNSFQKGGWLMRKEDIIGLTPEQIKDKFALKYVPKYVTDVKLPADTKIRISEANEIPGWGKGGGTQIDLLDERVGEFFNPRSLEGKWW